jgi:hypothetical protein
MTLPTKEADIADLLSKHLQRTLRLIETEYIVAKRERQNWCAREYLAMLNESKAALLAWEGMRQSKTGGSVEPQLARS